MSNFFSTRLIDKSSMMSYNKKIMALFIFIESV